MDGYADGYAEEQDAEPERMHQHYAYCDCDPKGTDGYDLDFAGDASVLLKVTNIRAQSRL